MRYVTKKIKNKIYKDYLNLQEPLLLTVFY